MSGESELERSKNYLEKKQNEDKLIADLVALAAAIKEAQALWSRQRTPEYHQKIQYEEIIRSALQKEDSGIRAFHHGIHTLGTAIKEVERRLEPYNIPKQVISDLLNAGGYAPLESDVYSAVSPTRTSSALFSPPKHNSFKYSSLAIAGVIGGAGLFTALALLIKSAVVVKAAVTVMAVSAAASAAFPPAAILGLSIGGAALLVAAIGIAAIAIKYYRDQKVGTRERIDAYHSAAASNAR